MLKKIMNCLFWCCIIAIIVSRIIIGEEVPGKPKILSISGYCKIAMDMWDFNNTILREKIAAADSLYQIPDRFYEVEKSLNNQLQAWQDSVMAEYNTGIAAFMKFGVDNKEKIEQFLIDSEYQQQLDSLQATHESLSADYESRLQGYDLGGE